MKKAVATAIAAVCVTATAWAADLVPHVFQPGSTIKSAEVNANFDGLRVAAAAQETRLQALEAAAAAPPSDQLICVLYTTWVVDGTAFPCVQATASSTQRSLTMAQILGEGWITVAIGGGDNSNRVVMTFKK